MDRCPASDYIIRNRGFLIPCGILLIYSIYPLVCDGLWFKQIIIYNLIHLPVGNLAKYSVLELRHEGKQTIQHSIYLEFSKDRT